MEHSTGNCWPIEPAKCSLHSANVWVAVETDHWTASTLHLLGTAYQHSTSERSKQQAAKMIGTSQLSLVPNFEFIKNAKKKKLNQIVRQANEWVQKLINAFLFTAHFRSYSVCPCLCRLVQFFSQPAISHQYKRIIVNVLISANNFYYNFCRLWNYTFRRYCTKWGHNLFAAVASLRSVIQSNWIGSNVSFTMILTHLFALILN